MNKSNEQTDSNDETEVNVNACFALTVMQKRKWEYKTRTTKNICLELS